MTGFTDYKHALLTPGYEGAETIYRTILANARTVTQDLLRGGKGWILLSVSAGWFLSIGVRFVYPSLLPFIREEFGIGLTIAGLLWSVLWVAYAVGQFPGGVLGDRLGEGNILVVSTLVSTAALVAVATSVHVWLLFLGTFAFGFATALYGPTRFTIFSDVYSTRAGTAVGVTMAAGNVGNTILPAVAAVVATTLSWRFGFGVLIPVFVLVTVALWVFVPSRTSTADHAADELSVETIRQILSGLAVRGVPAVAAIQIVLAFVNQGFLGFFPLYLIEIKEFSAQAASVMYGLYFFVGVGIQPLVGACRDRFGTRPTMMYVVAAYVAGLVVLQFTESVVVLVLATVCISHWNGTVVLTNTFVTDALPAEIRGSGLGLARTSWILLGAVGPTFVGYLGDLGMLEVAFLTLAGLAGVALALTVLIPREH